MVAAGDAVTRVSAKETPSVALSISNSVPDGFPLAPNPNDTETAVTPVVDNAIGAAAKETANPNPVSELQPAPLHPFTKP